MISTESPGPARAGLLEKLLDPARDAWTTGERLKRAAWDSGMTARDLCDEAGITPQAFSRMCRVDGSGYLDSWMKCAEILGVPLSAVVEPWALRAPAESESESKWPNPPKHLIRVWNRNRNE